MMGLINDITSSPDIYEELAKIFIAKLPKVYKIIDIVYRPLNLFENDVHGNQVDKIIIPSLQSRVHPYFKTTLLKNRQNTARTIESIFEYMHAEALQYLELLDSQETVLSSKDDCHKIQPPNNVTIDPYPPSFFVIRTKAILK